MTEAKYYKVLGGRPSGPVEKQTWSMQELEDGTTEPGAWREVEERPLRMGHNGFHITPDPAPWWRKGASCYEVEFEEPLTDKNGTVVKGYMARIVVARVRLMRKLSREDLEQIRIFETGEHSVKNGIACVCGNASLRACGNAYVFAHGNASVYAYENSKVHAYGNATIEASDLAIVTAYERATVSAQGLSEVYPSDYATVTVGGNVTVGACGSASVNAHGDSEITANGNAVVFACENSKVRARGNSIIRAFENATVRAEEESTVFTEGVTIVDEDYRYINPNRAHVYVLSGSAVHIDRRTNHSSQAVRMEITAGRQSNFLRWLHRWLTRYEKCWEA